MPDVSLLLYHLEKVKKLPSRKYAESYSALCPVHTDKTPSLCVDVTHTGKILIFCHAGCSIAAVLESIHLNMADLFPDNSYTRPPGYKSDQIDHALIVSQICQSDLKHKKTPKREDLPTINRALKTLLFTKNLLEKNHAP
jgi:putative DNA primase/helicase